MTKPIVVLLCWKDHKSEGYKMSTFYSILPRIIVMLIYYTLFVFLFRQTRFYIFHKTSYLLEQSSFKLHETCLFLLHRLLFYIDQMWYNFYITLLDKAFYQCRVIELFWALISLRWKNCDWRRIIQILQ